MKIEISDIEATIIYNKLKELKDSVIKRPNFYETANDTLDFLRVATHANTINRVNFRRSYKTLRTLSGKINELANIQQVDKEYVSNAFIKILNPMLKALENNVIDIPNDEQKKQMFFENARIKMSMVEKAKFSDNEIFKQYDDYDEDESEDEDINLEDLDETLIKKLSGHKGLKTLTINVEKNLRKALKKGLKISDPKERLKLDIGSLTKTNYVKEEKPVYNEAFSVLKDFKVKPKETTSELDELVQKGLDYIDTLSANQLKELKKQLPKKEQKELLVNSDEFLREQLKQAENFNINKYDIPKLEPNDKFKMFRAPLLVMTSPFFSSDKLATVKSLKAYSIFPGWVFDDQIVVTIPDTLPKMKKEYDKIISEIRKMLKKSTGQYWIHETENMEFRLRGYKNQLFLWFVPEEYVFHLGTFTLEDIQFPSSGQVINRGNAKELSKKRLERSEAVDSFLLPYYNALDKKENSVDSMQKLLDKLDSRLHEIDNIISAPASTFSVSSIIARTKQKDKVLKNREYYVDLRKKLESQMNNNLRMVKSYTRKLNMLDKSLKHSSSNLLEVDMSDYEELLSA